MTTTRSPGFWDSFQNQFVQDYYHEPKAGMNYWWGDEGVGLNKAFKGENINWDSFFPSPSKLREIPGHVKAGAWKQAGKSLVGSTGKMGITALSSLPIVGTAFDVAQPFLRAGIGQEWDDAIVGSVGDIGGSVGGAAAGAAIGTMFGPVGTVAGGFIGAMVGGTGGSNAANWAWGKVTGDDTWGGWRTSPKAIKEEKANPQISNQQEPQYLSPEEERYVKGGFTWEPYRMEY